MKHSVNISGHQTSFSLEPEFWAELKKIAADKKMPLGILITEIDNNRHGNLSSAIRLYILNTLKQEIVKNKQSQKNPINGKNSKGFFPDPIHQKTNHNQSEQSGQ